MIEITTDKSCLNLDFIHAFLSKSYWANTRTKAEIEHSIEHSTCFGVYLGGEQIGFARVLSDQVVFAYIMDVFIDENHRGKGYSKLLVKEILETPDFQNVKKWYLKTKDAHGLYQQFGFELLPDPEKAMELNK